MRELGTVVGVDQREQQIDAGGDTGRGPHVAVPEEDLVRLDLHVRVPPGELVAGLPVAGDPTATETPRGGEDERSGADRRRLAELGG